METCAPAAASENRSGESDLHRSRQARSVQVFCDCERAREHPSCTPFWRRAHHLFTRDPHGISISSGPGSGALGSYKT
jgi:hypothetical protein